MSPAEPQKDATSSVQQTGATARIAYGDDPLQFGDLYVPDGEELHALVLLIHGGFWRAPYGLSLMTGLAKDLVQRDIAVWNIEYRRIGDAGGGWPGTLRDVALATDFLRKLASTYPLDLQRVVSVGHSAGGHLALWLAARHKLPPQSTLSRKTPPLALTGAISLAGAMDLEHVWQLNLGSGAAAALLGGSPTEVADRYALASPAALLPLGLPQILLHGTRDDRVPLEVSRSYRSKAMHAGDSVTLIELPGADHFVLIDATSSAWARTVQELQKLFS